MTDPSWDHFFAARLGTPELATHLIATFQETLRKYFSANGVPNEDLEELAAQTFVELFRPENSGRFTRGGPWGSERPFVEMLLAHGGPAWVVLTRYRGPDHE
jgi:hypothetical protein